MSLFLAWLPLFVLNAQNDPLDSLNQALRLVDDDSSKIRVLFELAKVSEVVEARAFLEEARTIAEELQDLESLGVARVLEADITFNEGDRQFAFSLYNQGIALMDSAGSDLFEAETRYAVGIKQLNVGMYAEAIENFLTASEYRMNKGDTALVIVIYGRLANAYQRKGDYPSSIGISEKGLILAERIASPRHAAITVNNLGIAYRNKGEVDKALDYYYQALAYARTGEILHYQAAFLENIGIVHSNRGEYVDALTAYLEAQRIYNSLGDEASVISLGHNIGLIYKLNHEYDKALDYYANSLAYDTEHSDTLGIISNHHNIGSAYLEMNELDKAEFHLKTTYDLLKVSQLKCLDGIGGLIGKLYMKQGMIDSARYYLEEEVASFSNCDAFSDYPEVILLLAQVRSSQGRNKEALGLFQESLQLAERAGYMEVIKKSAQALYQWHKNAGNAGQALKYHEKFKTSEDSLFNQQNTRELAWLEANYQMETLADSLNNVKQADADKLNQRIEDQRKRQRNLWILIGVVTVVFMLLFLYIKKRRELNHQVELDKERKAGFKATLNATEEERTRIAKDLHDGVVQQIGAMKLMLNHVAKQLDGNEAKEIKEVAQLAERTATETRAISHQMMPKALSDAGLLDAIQDMISKQLLVLGYQVDFQHFNLKDRYESGIEFTCYRVFQELINNLLKHANAKHIDIQLMENGNKLILVVEDDGIGFNMDQVQKGLGIENIKNRLATIEGAIDFSSQGHSGTVATVVIPL